MYHTLKVYAKQAFKFMCTRKIYILRKNHVAFSGQNKHQLQNKHDNFWIVFSNKSIKFTTKITLFNRI